MGPNDNCNCREGLCHTCQLNNSMGRVRQCMRHSISSGGGEWVCGGVCVVVCGGVRVCVCVCVCVRVGVCVCVCLCVCVCVCVCIWGKATLELPYSKGICIFHTTG